MSTELELTGLDGANPLAFLAALGTLRTLSLAWPTANVRLAWQAKQAWTPVLVMPDDVDPQQVVEALHTQLNQLNPVFSRWDNTNKISPAEFRAYALDREKDWRPDNRVVADFLAALGNEGAVEDEFIQDTAFRTMSGAGHQDFLKTMRLLVGATTPQHLSEALFAPWTYQDDKPSLRWDPLDDRRYALRWLDPSSDPICTVRGANRLAVEALPLFPTMPTGRQLATTGFRGRKSKDTFLRWPIWHGFLSVNVVRSVLAMPELHAPQPNRAWLAAQGVAEIYQSQRIIVDKFRNFTASKPV